MKKIIFVALMIISSSTFSQSYGYDNSYNEYRYRSQTPGLNGYSNADMIRDQGNFLRRQLERDMVELDVRSNAMIDRMINERPSSQGSRSGYDRY